MDRQIVAMGERIPRVMMRRTEAQPLVVGNRPRYVRDHKDRLDAHDASHAEIIGVDAHLALASGQSSGSEEHLAASRSDLLDGRSASGSPGAGPRLEDDDRGPRRAASRVAIDVVPHLAPSGPEALVLLALRRPPPMDGARAIGKLDRGVGARLQVEPPGGLGVFPTVHRHRDQVRTILVIAEDHAALLAGAAADRGEAHRPPAVRLRGPEALPAATEPIDRAVNDPGGDNDPARRESRGSFRRVGHGEMMSRAGARSQRGSRECFAGPTELADHMAIDY